MRLHFISFGQKPDYYRLSSNLLKNLFKAYPESNLHLFSDEDLPNEMYQFCSTNKRGYGFWIWKPYFINNVINKIDYDDIVVYVDGRLHFRDSKLELLDNFIKLDSKDCMLWKLDFPEKQYSTKEIMEQFQVDYEDMNSGQYGSSIIIFRKNNLTMRLFNDWFNLFENNINLITDYYNNKNLTSPEFIEHRHDQSALSILSKQYIKLHKLNIHEISVFDLLKKNSLYTNYFSHPLNQRMVIWNKIKAIVKPELIYKIIFIKNYFFKVKKTRYFE